MTYNNSGSCEHLSETSRGVIRERPFKIIPRVEAGIVIDTINHVIFRLMTFGVCSGSSIVSEDVNARH